MNEKFYSKNIENDEFTGRTEESEYEVLISRLEEISVIINLLGKTTFR